MEVLPVILVKLAKENNQTLIAFCKTFKDWIDDQEALSVGYNKDEIISALDYQIDQAEKMEEIYDNYINFHYSDSFKNIIDKIKKLK